jgi:unsaturated chondroitin disaccharide hydrolase
MRSILEQTVKKLEKTIIHVQDKIPYVAKSDHYDDYTDHPSWWTNGFYPGILWHMYQYTKDENYATLAINVEKKLDPVLDGFQKVDHDAGFMWHLSSGNHFRFKGDQHARIQALKAASFLASRYHPQGEYIRAWNGDWARGHAIIDTLMNLPLLYWASKEMQDDGFAQIARKQADTAIKEFIRVDGSVYHIVVFDEKTGKRVGQRYGQGYSEQSSWARGTSWALYGFAISYRETSDERYLQAAQKVAQFIINHMPSDFIPYADYLAPDEPRRKRDSSAGAITACGFILLGTLLNNQEYLSYGKKIIQALYDHCYADETHDAILLHGNVAYHAEDETDTDLSIIYGDYYFLEALLMIHDYKGFF